MDTKETKGLSRIDTLLISNEAYYKYIFKKTEKIVCAVFYILEQVDKGHKERPKSALEAVAMDALERALTTLSRQWYAATHELIELSGALSSLASHVRVARAAGLVGADAADLLTLELDAVVRGIRPYLSFERGVASDLTAFGLGEQAAERTSSTTRSAPKSPRTETVATSTGTTQKGQRSERQKVIKDILASQGQATIKDISDRMPEYSEKTVQRELVSMVSLGEVVKEGERRWSRYRLAEVVM